jgi:N4-(beta-N-acetylglucosaminyl)-L-asparaginase
MTPHDAVLDALKRVSRNFNHDQSRLRKFDLNFYALRQDGQYAGGSLWNSSVKAGKLVRKKFVVNDGGASRLEDCIFLYERTVAG